MTKNLPHNYQNIEEIRSLILIKRKELQDIDKFDLHKNEDKYRAFIGYDPSSIISDIFGSLFGFNYSALGALPPLFNKLGKGIKTSLLKTDDVKNELLDIERNLAIVADECTRGSNLIKEEYNKEVEKLKDKYDKVFQLHNDKYIPKMQELANRHSDIALGIEQNILDKRKGIIDEIDKLDALMSEKIEKIYGLENWIHTEEPEKIPYGLSGVYGFIDNGEITYIGKSKNIRSRIKGNHHKYNDNFSIVYFQVDDPATRSFLETRYINEIKPELNTRME